MWSRTLCSTLPTIISACLFSIFGNVKSLLSLPPSQVGQFLSEPKKVMHLSLCCTHRDVMISLVFCLKKPNIANL